jgi:hypothetical protein
MSVAPKENPDRQEGKRGREAHRRELVGVRNCAQMVGYHAEMTRVKITGRNRRYSKSIAVNPSNRTLRDPMHEGLYKCKIEEGTTDTRG